jgi:hypothetical protein
MKELLINLAISITGSAITMFIAYFWKLRRLFEKYHFPNQKSAEKSIINDIRKSKTLRVYAMCASTFSDKEKSNIAKEVLGDSNLKQLYLISDKDNENIQKRQGELPRNGSHLETKIKNSINNFLAAKEENNGIEFRLHKEKVGFRLIILDDNMYLSQQERDKYGKDTEIQRISCGTPAYINFLAYFDKLWAEHNPDQPNNF